MRLRIKRAQFFARPILRGFGVFAAGFDETFCDPAASRISASSSSVSFPSALLSAAASGISCSAQSR
ncbi:MAG: hypothetical protein ACLRTQ_00305 [Candidatus Borkfalkia sp.]